MPLEVLGDKGNNSNCVPDVLPPEKRGSALLCNFDVSKEEAGALAVESRALPSSADVLARRASSDEVHKATPRARVEGVEVVPDRSRCQGLLFHPCHEDGRSEGIPLDVHHRLHSTGVGESEVESSDAAAHADRSSRGTCIHGMFQCSAGQ